MTSYEEKMTDVNIAVELLGDAQDDAFDTAIIISGDSDLTPPVRATLSRYPETSDCCLSTGQTLITIGTCCDSGV